MTPWAWVKKKAKEAKRKMRDAANAAKRIADKAARETEKLAKEAKQKADRIARDAIKEAEKIAKKAAEELEKASMSIIDDAKKLANKAKNDIEGVVNRAKNEIEGVANKVKTEVEGVAKQAKTEIEGAADVVKKEVESLPGKTEALVTEKLPALMREAMEALAKEAIKPVLKQAAKDARAWHRAMKKLREERPDLVDAIDALGFVVTLKCNVEIELEYANFYTRAEEIAGILDRFGDDGIKPRRRDIIGFMRATGPTAVDLGIGAELSLGVDIGGSAKLSSIPLELFLELADLALEELGVPE